MKLSETVVTVRKALQEVWSHNAGKLGLILIVLFVAVSLYALAVIPPNYKTIWSDARYWKTNPQSAPPAWVSMFGVNLAPQMDVKLYKPKETKNYRIFTYTAEYDLTVNDFPQRIAAEVKGLRVATRNVPNIIILELYVTRPDGKTLLVGRDTIKAATNQSVIYTEEPFYFEVDSNLIRAEYLKVYGVSVSHGNEIRALFGERQNATSQRFVPLKGTYKISLKITYTQGKLDPGKRPAEYVRIIVVGNLYGLMGTDSLGRDLAQGLLYGFPVALAVGLVTAVAATAIGVLAGIISGYYGGWIDEVLQRLIDVMGNVPLLPFLILLVNVTPMEYRLTVIILVLIIFGWGGLAIIIRSMTLSIKSELYIEAARSVGASNRRIIFRHILPQVLPYSMATLVFSVPGAVLAEAGLSVIGLEHGWPTWGKILADARRSIAAAGGTNWYWWWIIPPGLLLSLMSLAFVLLGMAIETIVEPRLKRRA